MLRKLKNALVITALMFVPLLLCANPFAILRTENFPIPLTQPLPFPPRYVYFLRGVHLPPPPKLHIKTLSLKEAILLSMRYNPGVQNSKLDRVVAKFSLEVARNEFQFRYKLNGAMNFGKNQKPLYGLNAATTLKTTIGTEISAAVNSNWGRGGTLSSATLSIVQPLLRGFGQDVNLVALHNAQASEHINWLALKNTMISTVTTVIQSYYAVVQAYNQLAVQKIALKQAVNNLKQIEEKIKVGKAAEAEAVQQRAQIANQKLTITVQENNIKAQYQNLLVVLGLSPYSQLLINKTIHTGPLETPPLEPSINAALAKNVDFQIALIGLDVVKRDLLFAKNQQLPELNVSAETTEKVSQPRTTESSGNIGEKRVNLNFDVPIDDMSRQSQLVDAKISLEKTKVTIADIKRQLISTVIDGVRDLKAQKEQIMLAENAVELAKKDYHNFITAWEYGKTTLFEVTIKRNQLERSRIDLINQKINYITILSTFQQNLGITLDLWNIKVRDALQ